MGTKLRLIGPLGKAVLAGCLPPMLMPTKSLVEKILILKT
ncbi:hypothetical protein J543_2403 [Acinetobacter baumannii 1159076]|nr:hypothetical protein J543_2403 [Acinetobacter baumannii 1159076]